MADWLKKKVSNIGSLKLIRKEDDEVKIAANEFKQLVSNLKKGGQISDCVFCFLEKLARKSIDELRSCKIEKEIAILSRKYSKLMATNVSDLTKLGEALAYFNTAIQLFTPDAKTSKNLLLFVCAIMDTNNVEILDLSSDFIHSLTDSQQFINFTFQGESLKNLWSSCFISHENTNNFFGSIFLAAASNFEFKNYETIEPLINRATEALSKMEITPNIIPNSISFLGFCIHKINTGKFIPTILPNIAEIAPMLQSLQFFENILVAPSDDMKVAWKTLEDIVSNKELPTNLVKTALIAIHNSNCKIPSYFSFVPFIRCYKEFPPTIQKILFDMLEGAPTVVKARFLCHVSPLKETQIDTQSLSNLVAQEEYGKYVENILNSFFLLSDPNVLYDYLNEDQNIYMIASTLLDQLPEESPAGLGLFGRFMEFANKGCEIIMPLINKIAQRITPDSYMDSLIGFIENGIPSFIFSGFITTIRKIDTWSDCFRKHGGSRVLSKVVESIEGINFLAVLCTDGPYMEIDDFINKEFDNCKLKELPSDTLVKLMLALPQDSTRPGYIRIPSLCAHVDQVPVSTPWDMYIFGTTGPHVMKMEKHHLAAVVGRVISSQQVSLVCDDPVLLSAATSPDAHHTSLYQFHTSATQCVATAKLTPSFSFWIYINECIGKTTLCSLDNGELSLELYGNGAKIFSNSEQLITFQLKNWNMITLTVVTEGINKKTNVYLDKDLVITLPKVYEQITFGSLNENNSVWYLSTTFQNSQTSWSSEQVTELYNQGYSAPAPYDISIKDGVKFVPYRGVVKYIHAMGGPDFIFLRLIKCENQETFLLYLQCAFNLLTLKQIQVREFFSSIRYILLRKPEMYNKQVEMMFMHEFMLNEEQFNWNYVCNMFCDFCFLSQSNISLNFVANSLTNNILPADSLPLLHYLLDTYVFFELNEVAEANLFLLLEGYINSQPHILNKIALFIVGIPFCESDDIEQNYDEKRIGKQTKLLHLLTRDTKIFSENVDSQLAFTIVPLLTTELSLQLFAFLAEICCQYPKYYNQKDFALCKHFIRQNVLDKNMWTTLFVFLTGKQAPSLDEYLSYDIIRPEIYSFLFTLVCDLLPIDMSSEQSENQRLSFSILHVLYSLGMTQHIDFTTMIVNIQRLCTFGFDERECSVYPFNLSSNEEISIPEKIFSLPSSSNSPSHPFHESRRKKSFMDTIKKTVIISQPEKPPLLGCELGYELDTDLYKQAYRYITSCVFNDDLVEIPQVLYQELPENFEELIKTSEEINDVVSLVVVIASKLLVEVSSDISDFKKALVRLTIYGADVIPKVAIIMHKKVIYGLIDQLHHLSSDAITALLEFLTCRVMEGWWDGEITTLFHSILKKIEKMVKSIHLFILACLYKLHSDPSDGIIVLATELIQFPLFKTLTKDSNFLQSFLFLVVTKNVVESELSKSMWLLLEQNLPQSQIKDEFMETIPESKQFDYVCEKDFETTFYDQLYKVIIELTLTNSQHVQAQRLKISRTSKLKKLNQFRKQCCSQTAIVRRMMRFQFFYRLNTKSLDVDEAISRLYRAYSRESQITEKSNRVMISYSTNPFCIPQKIVPCAYNYDIQCQKDKKASRMMPRSHHLTEFNTSIPELLIEQMAPQCLEGWHAPPFVPYGLLQLAADHFNIPKEKEKESIFSCRLLNTPEPLPCVCLINDESINFILYANIADDAEQRKLVLQENSQLLAHYALIESAVRGYAGESSLFSNHPTLTINFATVTVAVPRTYEYQDIACDVFTFSGTSMTIVFPNTSMRKAFMSNLKFSKKHSPVLGPQYAEHLLSNVSPESVARLWANQKISTLDYLLYLNAKSGRSFNDFSQYPVVPWVIGDYSSEDKPNAYRDLSKPMGMLSPARAEKYLQMYTETDPPYNYGTHYSYPAGVLHFMMRLEPFTLFNVMLHSGWDHNDRLFCDMQESWRSASGVNQADVKELIPQFYSVPSMYLNLNNIPLKTRTDGHPLSEVVLPPWASSPFDFVWKMRTALESQEVRERIPDWIDLIFGYKQRGQGAIEAHNVFHPLSYGFTETPPTQSDLDVINNFGQTPQQLYKDSPHIKPRKLDISTFVDTDTIHTAQLKRLRADTEKIRIKDEEIYALPKLCHVVGNLEFSIKERYFNVAGESPQFDDSLFDVSDSSLSRDHTLISIASESGFILNYLILLNQPQNHFQLTMSCYYPGAAFKVIACSTHFGVVCASTPTELFLFDLSTGLLMKKVETKDRIAHICIDDVHGFIIVAGSHLCSVYTINLELIGEHGAPTSITSLAVCESLRWTPHPFHITGHVDGTVYIWIIDFDKANNKQKTGEENEEPETKEEDNKLNIFREKVLMRALSLPISALAVYFEDKAIIASDIEGEAVLCATKTAGYLLKPSLFESCAICMQPLTSNASCCNYCGMPVCKNCRKSAKVCIACAATMEIPSEDFIDSEAESSK